jgi:ribosomal protein S18 acetylase RimI-like enzyme
MLTYAASMSPGGAPSVAEAQEDPHLRVYLDGWMRPGDLGVVAVGGDGGLLGAAWIRPGLMVAEPGAPELATAVAPAWRGRGIGSTLLRELAAWARGSWCGISLSVRQENPARRFYERHGFAVMREVTNRVGGRSLVMRLTLPAAV